ncbi:MAG: winged helix-turn-helix transcriptional regulator [Candidatus Aminicenantes bacterium]|nr:winged helix-turn-helix transcriptional regulator [Candidatus Aminicenantes bacterium]
MYESNRVANIYNPANQTEEELRKNFVIRELEFKTIFERIKNSPMKHPEQHFIIQGQRGFGKTTLLLRLYYEIKNDEDLSKNVIPVIFNEEQYNINSLFSLWSSVAEHLEEWSGFTGLYDNVEATYNLGDPEREAFSLLETALKKNEKKLVLLIDNITQIFGKLVEKEQQFLKHVLITSPEIRIIGASSIIQERTFEASRSFYEFFSILNLKGLTGEDTQKLLLSLGKYHNKKNIERILTQEPGRVESLRRLTGGVPRTIILLYEIFADFREGDAFQDLEFILDRVTPLYKHRMDDLSPHQQKIVDAIALNWDAVSAKEISEIVRLESKAVSSHLMQLEKNRIIRKIKTGTKNFLYQINERFFNIWYLMRYGRRRGRSRVQWLIHFLQNWCKGEELKERAERLILSIENGKVHEKQALYMTEALSRTDIPAELQHKLILKARDFLLREHKNLLQELSKSDLELIDEAATSFEKKQLRVCVKSLRAIKHKATRNNLTLVFANALLEENKVKESIFLAKALFTDREYIEEFKLANTFFMLLMAKKQYAAALKIFSESHLDLKERFKPTYYALMYFMRNEHPNEYKRMGDELRETVDEIIDIIENFDEAYLRGS